MIAPDQHSECMDTVNSKDTRQEIMLYIFISGSPLFAEFGTFGGEGEHHTATV